MDTPPRYPPPQYTEISPSPTDLEVPTPYTPPPSYSSLMDDMPNETVLQDQRYVLLASLVHTFTRHLTSCSITRPASVTMKGDSKDKKILQEPNDK